MANMPTSYVFPCKNNGRCRQMMYEEQGWNWTGHYPKYGVVHLYEETKFGFETFRAGYHCCTQCHLPVDQAEATKLNTLLGFKLDEVVIDDEFLELLNDF